MAHQPAGAAYRSSPLPPPDFSAPLLPPHLELQAKLEDLSDQLGTRGMSDEGRIDINSSAGALTMAKNLASQDEPIKWFWTFDADGQPKLARFNPRKIRQPSAGLDDDEEGSNRVDYLLPPAGNRGLKLRPQGSLVPTTARESSSALDPTDELVAAQAPKWNAFGRLAPWTSGMTGPLSGQGEEEVGPSALAAGEEGEVGERRPRRGDREVSTTRSRLMCPSATEILTSLYASHRHRNR